MPPRESACFVCDVNVGGKHFPLSTTRTQSSKIKMWEKLSEVVGDQYMVIVSEMDIVCRGCASLINTVDRLEYELKNVKQVILRFLDKKYSLSEDAVQSPENNYEHVSKGLTRNEECNSGEKERSFEEVDSAVAGDDQVLSSSVMKEDKALGQKISPKSQTSKPKKNPNLWIQCDLCKYTTNYKSFMIYHIRQHMKKKVMNCDFCGDEVSAEYIKAQAEKDKSEVSDQSKNQGAIEEQDNEDMPQLDSAQETGNASDHVEECRFVKLEGNSAIVNICAGSDAETDVLTTEENDTSGQFVVVSADSGSVISNTSIMVNSAVSLCSAILPADTGESENPFVTTKVTKSVADNQESSVTASESNMLSATCKEESFCDLQTGLGKDDYKQIIQQSAGPFSEICKVEVSESDDIEQYIVENNVSEHFMSGDDIEMVEVWDSDQLP